jgi:hypothetical protein
MPKHVAFLIDVNSKEFGCVRLNIVYHYICLNIHSGMDTIKTICKCYILNLAICFDLRGSSSDQ